MGTLRSADAAYRATREAALALAERWHGAGGGYLDGMVVFFSTGDGPPWPERVDAAWIPERERDGMRVHGPDLDDPATRGAALEVVRERWQDRDGESLTPWRSGPGAEWVLLGGPVSARGATEAEALVAALEAAPG